MGPFYVFMYVRYTIWKSIPDQARLFRHSLLRIDKEAPFVCHLSAYSEVSNRRADSNKQAGVLFLKFTN